MAGGVKKEADKKSDAEEVKAETKKAADNRAKASGAEKAAAETAVVVNAEAVAENAVAAQTASETQPAVPMLVGVRGGGAIMTMLTPAAGSHCAMLRVSIPASVHAAATTQPANLAGQVGTLVPPAELTKKRRICAPFVVILSVQQSSGVLRATKCPIVWLI
jgi:uncharacterized membrane protein YdbT with pleckstrin-like domain